jgi:tetratricopeptide (TPR) repeat protein
MTTKRTGFIISPIVTALGSHPVQVQSTASSPRWTCDAGRPPSTFRRRALLAAAAGAVVAAAIAVPTPSMSGTPASTPTDALTGTDRIKAIKALRSVTEMQNKAFALTNRGAFADADAVWTDIIALNDTNAAAWSNRGNCRTSQGRFVEAVADFDRAIVLAPEEPDPHLGKGVALEGLRKYEDALHEYDRSNECSLALYGVPDPVVFNNRGNVYGLGMGDWARAIESFHRAALLSREYVFARANEALATYQLGKRAEGKRMMETLLRKYPDFPDLRAALVAVYWSEDGRQGDAETYWLTVLEQDSRYNDIKWVRSIRRWPPILVTELNNFLSLREHGS